MANEPVDDPSEHRRALGALGQPLRHLQAGERGRIDGELVGVLELVEERRRRT